MSPPTSAEQRAKIEALLADGKIPRKDIGKHVDPPVCYGTVVRIQRNLKKYGTTNKPRQGVVGRPAKITEPMAQVRRNSFPFPFLSRGGFSIPSIHVVHFSNCL